MTVDVADAIFARFGVPQASRMDKGELKKYYRVLVVKHHPDKGGKTKDMQYINAAYDVLNTATPSQQPSDIHPPHKTYPKGENKERLQKIKVEFRFEDDTPIASGKSDYFDILKIYKLLTKTLGVDVTFDPHSPYDEKNERWRTNTVVIYVDDREIERSSTIAYILKDLSQYYS